MGHKLWFVGGTPDRWPANSSEEFPNKPQDRLGPCPSLLTHTELDLFTRNQFVLGKEKEEGQGKGTGDTGLSSSGRQ